MMFAYLIATPVVLFVIAGLLLSAYCRKQFSHWRRKGVPYAKPELFFGNFKELFFQRKSFSHFLQELHIKGKGQSVFGFYIFGRPALLVNDPKTINYVFIKDFSHFADRYVAADQKHDPLGSHNLFTEKGQPWRRMRKKITPVFTSGRMKNMFSMERECGAYLQEHLDHVGASGGRPVAVKEAMARFATDVIATCAYGIQANAMRDADADFRKFGRAVFEFGPWRTFETMVVFFAPTLAKLGVFKFFSTPTTRYLHRVFREVIAVREMNDIKRNDLVDMLIQLKNKGSITGYGPKDSDESVKLNSKMSDFTVDDLVAQAAIFFTAGYETNSSTLTFCLYELSGSPEIQQTLRQEIVDTLDTYGDKITYEIMQEMDYLRKCVSETLRKYPPFGFLDRVCTKDYVIPDTDVLVEKGTPVYVPVFGIHRDPDYYPDPQRFDPERFSEENRLKRMKHTFLPFGRGPHNCIVLYCPAVWDTVLCWPPTEAGTTAIQRCPKSKGIDDSKYAYKTCRPEGVWQGRLPGDQGSPWGWTNYSTCLKPDLLKSMKKLYGMYVESYKEKISVSVSGWTVEQVGLSLSLIALLASFFIFYKSRCGRGKEVRVHRNMFGSMLAQVALRLLIYMDRALNVGDMEQLPSPLQLRNTPILCEICYTLLEYARTAMFLWLLMDAYVTHSRVTESVLKRKLGYRTSLAIGWGSPVAITTTWLVTTLMKHSTQRCLRGYTSTPYFWILFGPRICFICLTFALLINTIRLAFVKHKYSQSEDIEKVRRAAKMELALLPLLSVSDVYLVATTSLPKSLWQLQMWVYSYRVFRGCQGLFMALLYCLLRREVYVGAWQWAGHYLASRRYERARHGDSQLCEPGESSSTTAAEDDDAADTSPDWRSRLAAILRR